MPGEQVGQSLEQEALPGLVPIDSREAKIRAILDLLIENCGRVKKNRKNQKGPDLIGDDLNAYEAWLGEAHQYFTKASQTNMPLTYASEWVLDNYYILRQVLTQIREDMPESFYRQLPRLTVPLLSEFPRAYFVAYQFLRQQNYLVDMNDLRMVLVRLQEPILLTLGELWALPIFLRFCLIEKLANVLFMIIHPGRMAEFPERSFLEDTPGFPVSNEKVSSDDIVANIILSLRILSEQEWNEFIEAISRLERTLREEPAGIYPCMDFETRDMYRKEIEKLSFASGREEIELAEILVKMAFDEQQAEILTQKVSTETNRKGELQAGVHIGEFLFGKRRIDYEHRIGYMPNAKVTLQRGIRHRLSAFFIGGNLFLLAIFTISFLLLIHFPKIVTQPALFDNGVWSLTSLPLRWGVIAVLLLLNSIPALTIGTSLVSWLAAVLFRPRILPKLDFRDGIPESNRTLVVIPGMIHSCEDVDSLVQQMNLHFLRNPEPGLLFALLSDFRDANSEVLPEDEDLVKYAKDRVDNLNASHAAENGSPKFYFFHRKRVWNPSEGKWMGWERKRGKLHELNQFLRGQRNLTFTTISEDLYNERDPLQNIRFVITLDADTVLPRGAACRLAGTLAHPLNHAEFDPNTGRVINGYTVLQPRMEIFPKSVNNSWFTRIFAGDTGLDLYTLAVSDTYQDLFGEGIYVGKGIYDVDAFSKSVGEHIPENSILSHDLLEGLLGRAGLVTDVTMIEDYPQNYIIQAMRQRRWIRGDYQLLPWLINPGRYGVTFSALDRWKMFDNLRRALLAPSLMLMFILGMALIPGLGRLWTGILLVTLGLPILTSLAQSTLQIVYGSNPKTAFRPIGWSLARGLLAVAFLPYEAYFCIDAIFTTLYRLLVSRRNLLQWTTAAQTASLFGIQGRRNISWLKMNGVAVVAVIFAAGLQLIASATGEGFSRGVILSSPVLLLWLTSPLIAWRINLPLVEKAVSLEEGQTNLVRQLARRTWGFFERFIGPEDHWLPPDNYQESPVGVIAHRTSPTNIGLLLTSTLAAYDLGYLGPIALAARLATTMETMSHLERFNGHFINWYDTLTLQPLNPRYISTVDSGNLAACLIITAQACRQIPDEPIFRWEMWQGYLDSLGILIDILKEMRSPACAQRVDEIEHEIIKIRSEITAMRGREELWFALFQKTSGPFWHDISKRLMELIQSSGANFDLKTLEKLQEVKTQTERHHLAAQRILSMLVPWISLLAQSPEVLNKDEFVELFSEVKACLPGKILLGQVRDCVEKAGSVIEKLKVRIDESFTTDNRDNASCEISDARDWVRKVADSLKEADANSQALLEQYEQIIEQAEQFIREMDFRFLYNSQRQVFHIGYNLVTSQLDRNFYDLLASEARITSIVAIGKGEVPQSHWMHLARPITRVDSSYVLLSWSGTMFEYLMPPLFLRSYPGTLLSDSIKGAVQRQIEYGKSKGVPWGISESGFYRFDANQNYQYRAFGVPGLGYKRGLGDDLVIAPYASLMALAIAPDEVVKNLKSFLERKMIGLYGAYEAVDFTHDRLMLDQASAVIYEYMAHHQGMTMMSLANFLCGNVMVKRMHSDSRVQSVELLLQEQIPRSAPVQDPYSEDVKGVQRQIGVKIEVSPWKVPVQTPVPQVNLLSNGVYNVIVTNMGGGYSTWKDTDLTRWQADGVLDPWGSWIYIQDLKPGGMLWSAAHHPVPGNAANTSVTFFAHMASFRRNENGIASTLEITVSPEDPVEIRKLHLHNSTASERQLRLVSYGEVILTNQREDTRHPAFKKLFIESEFISELNLQIFKRRPRSNQEAGIFLGHMLVRKQGVESVEHEADRCRFIGRDRTFHRPVELVTGEPLSGTSGATFDPILSLGVKVKVGALENDELAFLTLAADSREEMIALAKRYQSWTQVERTFHQANSAAQTWLSKQEITTEEFKNILQTLSLLHYPFRPARAGAEILTANKLGQNGLWRFGVSGDYPILLVEVDQPDQLELVQQALKVHKYLRSRNVMVDLVFLNQQKTDYGAELRGNIYRLINRLNGGDFLNQRGGIFILYGDQITLEEETLLKAAARVLLNGQKGSLADQMPGYSMPVHHLPELVTTRSPEMPSVQSSPPGGEILLRFFNGYGGFSADGREYQIVLAPGRNTPAPWVNVIGYPQLGFIVSESGSQCTWAINSGENRLTPWSNDPVSDGSGEVLYLRDEETGEVWTPTPLPAGKDYTIRVKHGAGYSVFEHESHGLRQQMTLFASPEDPVKIVLLRISNLGNYPRRITASQYVEWVLGTTHSYEGPYLIPEYFAGSECLLATNPYNTEFASRVAFMIASKPLHGFTTDRAEFIGRSGTLESPAALKRMGLERRVSAGEDLCGVLQVHLDLLPGSEEEIYFVIGQGSDRKHTLALARKYHNPDSVASAYRATQAFWDRLLGTIQVHTPNSAMDLVLNRWMLYQALSCRIWGRSGFYQSSGAFGFRDQLQDVLAALMVDPTITKSQILNAAQHQFEEGDVLHWWHPRSGRGVRTRFSDDMLWLPYVTALYIEATKDEKILDERVPFLSSSMLKDNENERYGEYRSTLEEFSLLDHCNRAIERGLTLGVHRLPLIGTGDWNDGFNRIGKDGKGESVWMAWFLGDVLQRFATVCESKGDKLTAQHYRDKAAQYAAAVEENAWDGAWYRRAYFDNGDPLGSKDGLECQIDCIAQSWAVLSGLGNSQRCDIAMRSVKERLIRPEDRLLLLFTPPFDKAPLDPGYIKGYLPGIRENGGQYTHAAVWSAWAFAKMGEGKQAEALFDLLNPIFQADNKEKADIYRVEPFAICADIYSVPPNIRRGGWSWYTGSAAWFYRLGVEAILGMHKVGELLQIDPTIPPDWKGFEIRYRHGDATYLINVQNPEGVERGVKQVCIDDQLLIGSEIPLVKDKKEHWVDVLMGK